MWFTLERWILGGPPVPGASLLLATSLVLLIVTPSLQQQEQRGTQEIPETTFSCDGRVPGYYADPETGCQVYHMCEAGGRKFSYRCPEQTLFQQRMMVCDHWFMVDCKTSALHYAANLLLGDKTKLFIGAGETVQREFVHDAKAPRYRSDRLSFGNKKSSTRRVPVNQKNKQNVSSIIEDIDLRTFPTTLFPFSSQVTTLPPPLSPETINSEIIAEITPRPSTLFTRINQISTSKNRPTTQSTLSPTRFITERPTTRTTRYRFLTTQRPEISRVTERIPQGFSTPIIPNNVSREINLALETTQSLPETTTSKPTTTQYNEELFYPSTINSLLRNIDDRNEPALLQIIPDTRRMFFIPHNLESIPSDFEEQNLEFIQPSRNDHIRRMRFNQDIGDFNNARGQGCPPKCIPAFFRPGSCEPCVILR